MQLDNVSRKPVAWIVNFLTFSTSEVSKKGCLLRSSSIAEETNLGSPKNSLAS